MGFTEDKVKVSLEFEKLDGTGSGFRLKIILFFFK